MCTSKESHSQIRATAIHPLFGFDSAAETEGQVGLDICHSKSRHTDNSIYVVWQIIQMPTAANGDAGDFNANRHGRVIDMNYSWS